MKTLFPLLFLSLTTPLLAAPSYYQKQSTWQETVRVSREALAQWEADKDEERASGRKPLDIELDGGQPVPLEYSVDGLKMVYLGGAPLKEGKGNIYFLDAGFVGVDGKFVRLKSLKGVKKIGDGRCHFDNDTRRWKPVKAGDTEHKYGFYLSDRTEVGIPCPEGSRAFRALVYTSGKNKPKARRAWASVYSRLNITTKAANDREGVWSLIHADFPADTASGAIAAERKAGIWKKDWKPGDTKALAKRYAKACIAKLKEEADRLVAADPVDLLAVRALFTKSEICRTRLAELQRIQPDRLRLAIEDLTRTFPKRYPKAFLAELGRYERALPALIDGAKAGNESSVNEAGEFLAWQRKALLANPLLDFDRLIVLRRNVGSKARQVMGREMGMPPLNSHTLECVRPIGWDHEIDVLSDLRGSRELSTVYKPKNQEIISEIDLHFDGDRMMFSSAGSHDRWHVFEINVDGTGLKQLTPPDYTDVDFFDSCYLPDGRIVTTSTAPFAALPCENGSKHMACLYLLDPADGKMRQLTFEQDSDWCPTMLPNGRILYLRWEYTDTPHYFTRLLFHCNPDGTDQKEFYGSNSYFPNAFFFARPIPGHPTQVVGIVGGHHGITRSGRMMILDTARGRHEADGVVQEIPGYGKPVEPIILDRLVDGVWPQLIHPYPLSDPATGLGAGKYFLVSMKRDKDALWGVYLVDMFDNMTLLKEVEGAALLEPYPMKSRPTPPVIPDVVEEGEKTATFLLMDVYAGPGLKGVPRGTVKNLRLFAYHYCYKKTGGHASVGVESSWDIKRVLGTVPVEADGSAFFEVPANTPFSIQPLDKDGRALQLMRSWTVGMPGEVVSCIGCHLPQNEAASAKPTVMAAKRTPSKIQPWQGPVRPFAFRFEVQPVLDRYCVGCHSGKEGQPDFRAAGQRVAYSADRAYMCLQPYVRRPGPEGDYHIMKPMEYHASTSELIQMLEKGHHNVQLDAASKERLYAWIDLNAPYRGKWAPQDGQDKRRLDLACKYANVNTYPEGEYDRMGREAEKRGPIKPVMPEPVARPEYRLVKPAGWPFDAHKARQAQVEAMSAAKGTYATKTAIDAPQPTGANDATGIPSGLELGEWHVLGPLTLGKGDAFSHDFGPEKSVDLKRPVGNVAWQKRAEWEDGTVIRLTGSSGNLATYCYRTITSSEARTVTAYLGSDDGIAVWLNGGQVWTNNVPRGVSPNDDQVKLPLQAGENRLLLKIFNLRGGYGFYFSLSPKPGLSSGSGSSYPAKTIAGRTIDLGGVKMDFVLVPAGEFVMGSADGPLDEAPPSGVKIEKPFWMSVTEISNEQYARFDPEHDSAYFDRMGKDHKDRGYPANTPGQPVIRVSWNRAMDFCRWLSEKSGEKVTLPTEAQWEWGCRAGRGSPFWFGAADADFSKYANLADRSGSRAGPHLPVAGGVNDGAQFGVAVGRYLPNPWGLMDMHGNVAEWTRSSYVAYPYHDGDGRNTDATGRKVARGGSWRDRPHRATASHRLAYEPYQPVVNVGFRVILEAAQ